MTHRPLIAKSFVASLVALVALVVAPPMVSAAESAEQHLKRGVRLLSQNKDNEALEEFRAAYALSPSPKAAVEMGLAEASLKLWVDAEKHLGEGLGEDTDSWVSLHKTLIEEQLAKVREHLGWLIIDGTPQAEVVVNGTVVGRLPLLGSGLRLAEGFVTVRGRLLGRETPAERVEIVAETERTVSLHLPVSVRSSPAPTKVQPAPPPAPAKPQPVRPVVAEPRPEGATHATFYRSLPWVSTVTGAFALGDIALMYSKRSCNDGDASCGPSEAFKIGVLVAGTAGLVMGLGAALMEAVRRPDPRLVKPFLIASSALAGVGAIAGGMSLIEGGVYGPSKVGFGIGTMTLGTVALFIDSLALLEATPERTQPVKVAVIPFLGGLSLLGTF
jgi:hypothetical protein